jgi:inosine-uridine nucleoside N-ribohydrolase
LLSLGSVAAKLIAEPLQTYAMVQTVFGDTTDVSIPDVAAAMYALDSSLGTAQSALVKVVTEPSLARGQTVIGLNLNERLSMIASDAELNRLAEQAIADPTFNLPAALDAISAREPDNAQLVTDIKEQRIRELFFSALAPSKKTVSVPDPSSVLSVLAFSAFGATSLWKRKKKAG